MDISLLLPPSESWAFLASCIFAWLLVAVIVIDFETMLIPDRLSIGGACFGLILSFYFPSIHGIEYHPMGVKSLLGGITSLVGILVGSGFFTGLVPLPVVPLVGRLWGR